MKSIAKPETDTTISWALLVELEPSLLTLYHEAKAVKDDEKRPWFCANAVWYGRYGNEGFKQRLVELVGYSVTRRGGDPRLASSRAYDIAYHKIYQALPDCRSCVCWGFQDLVNERMAGPQQLERNARNKPCKSQSNK
jgi:hypothetical protein